MTIIITLSEVLVSSKSVTDTKQVYCPLSLLRSEENVIILVYCNLLLVSSDIVTRDDSDNESPPLQSVIISDDDTPSTTVTVQVRMRLSPTLGLSTDCDMSTDG